ncbi:MAG: Gfo/Idh/MocA family protein [bacterium]
MDKISVVLVAIGGYGNNYVKAILEEGDAYGVEIVGAVDPYPETCMYLEKLKGKGVPIYSDLKDFYKMQRADLTVISSPIHFHCKQTVVALENGSNVLCEKPASATVQEIREMILTRNKTGLKVAIGFQWAYDPAYIALKEDVMKGLLGRPKRLKTLVLWPRNTAYYRRSSWAGRKRDERGNWILDSVANNATAHFLHNMLHLLGKSMESSTMPVEVTAELYRANPIENFDTSTIRVLTEDGVEILFYATHAVKNLFGPIFAYEFESAIVVYNDPNIPESSNNLVARFKNGVIKEYGSPNHGSIRKLWKTIDAIRGEDIIYCPIESAMAHTLTINGAQESTPDITEFPEKLIKREGEPELIWVEGLEEALKYCYREEALPSEIGITWAKPGRKISLVGYTHFPTKYTNQ